MDPSGRLPKQVQLPGESVGRLGSITSSDGRERLRRLQRRWLIVGRTSADVGALSSNPVALLHIVTFSDWRLTSRCGF